MSTANAYPDLLAATSRLRDVELLEEPVRSHPESQRAFLAANGDVLAAIRNHLRRPCSVPLEFVDSFFDRHLADVQLIRTITRALQADAELAISRGDTAAAARAAIDLLLLSNGAGRGGLVTDALVGNCIAGAGLEILREVRADLEGDLQGEILEALGRFDRDREPFDEIRARDDEWSRRVGWQDDPFDPESFLQSSGTSEPEVEAVLALIQAAAREPDSKAPMLPEGDYRVRALARLLQTDIALQQLRDADGSFPSDLAELVPSFLSAVPIDPFTDKPLLYRRTSPTDFALYSTGPKRFDGGGRLGTWLDVTCGDADLLLDTQSVCPADG